MGDRLATIDMGQKVGAAVGPGPLSVGGARSPYNTVAWAEAYVRTKWHLDPTSRLAITCICRKWGSVPPFFLGGGLQDPCLTQCGLGLPPYQVAS